MLQEAKSKEDQKFNEIWKVGENQEKLEKQ